MSHLMWYFRDIAKIIMVDVMRDRFVCEFLKSAGEYLSADSLSGYADELFNAVEAAGFPEYVTHSLFNSVPLVKEKCLSRFYGDTFFHFSLFAKALVDAGMYEPFILFLPYSDNLSAFKYTSKQAISSVYGQHQKSLMVAWSLGIGLDEFSGYPSLGIAPVNVVDEYERSRGCIADPFSGKEGVDPLRNVNIYFRRV